VPRIHVAFPLDRAAGAHAVLEGRQSTGAILITP
jgi:hypothetical protein